MAQAKRRMAAQRERELRNYHQEQQYNRSASQTPQLHADQDRPQTNTPSRPSRGDGFE